MRANRSFVRRTVNAGYVACALAVVLLFTACSSTSGPSGGFGNEDRAGAGSDAGVVTLGDAASCSTSTPGQGCPCPQVGQTIACFTGPASSRNVGACHDGTQRCEQQRELTAWGACNGEQLDCRSPDGGGRGSEDAGGGIKPRRDAGLPVCTANPNGGCIPGATRWCDDGSCFWGKQTCQAGGTWDPCRDTPMRVGPSGCVGTYYDENCCEQAGACCAHAVDGKNYGSVGSCGAVDPCDQCQQLCAAGAVRWCNVYGGGRDANPPWGKQACLSNGTWASCARATTAPPGCGSTYDGTCCKQSGQCCEVFDAEAADPQSVNCPVTACDTHWASTGAPASRSPAPRDSHLLSVEIVAP